MPAPGTSTAAASPPSSCARREVVGSYGSSIEELAEVLGLLATGALSLPMAVGTIVPLDQIVEAMEQVREGDTGGGRIVVDVTR